MDVNPKSTSAQEHQISAFSALLDTDSLLSSLPLSPYSHMFLPWFPSALLPPAYLLYITYITYITEILPCLSDWGWKVLKGLTRAETDLWFISHPWHFAATFCSTVNHYNHTFTLCWAEVDAAITVNGFQKKSYPWCVQTNKIKSL